MLDDSIKDEFHRLDASVQSRTDEFTLMPLILILVLEK